MRWARALMLAATLGIAMLSGFGVSVADGGCTASHTHTAGGSCKDGGGHSNPENDYQIHCGGERPGRITEVSEIELHANQTTSGGEAEACSDGGSGNQHGRLVVAVDQSKGARVVLDSDPDQPFPAGWITAQAGAGSNPSGVYCSRDDGEPGTTRGDGYAQSWSNPGQDTGADCVPNPPTG